MGLPPTTYGTCSRGLVDAICCGCELPLLLNVASTAAVRWPVGKAATRASTHFTTFTSQYMKARRQRSGHVGPRRSSRKADLVLVLANPNDVHARAVAAEVAGTFGGRPVILDTREYPAGWHLTSTMGMAQDPAWLLHFGDWQARSEEVSGVWRRRPNPHRIHSDVNNRKARRFCLNEIAAGFQGWLHSLGEAVINPLAAEYAAIRKPFQLLKAKEAGLAIPDSIVTSGADEARRFIDRLDGKVIFKVLMGLPGIFAETRRFKREHARYLATLRYAPAIFQEIVEPGRDVRVTIVDEAAFSVLISPKNPKARLDWRLDLAADIVPHALPRQVERALVGLLRALGLRFGAIDLRVTSGGEYIFLEVNPSGQFLFCEIHGKQPISRAVAAALLGRS
jgi:glutathione synthase/RimK-type ligase-like ATP-grasp enzyme